MSVYIQWSHWCFFVCLWKQNQRNNNNNKHPLQKSRTKQNKTKKHKRSVIGCIHVFFLVCPPQIKTKQTKTTCILYIQKNIRCYSITFSLSLNVYILIVNKKETPYKQAKKQVGKGKVLIMIFLAIVSWTTKSNSCLRMRYKKVRHVISCWKNGSITIQLHANIENIVLPMISMMTTTRTATPMTTTTTTKKQTNKPNTPKTWPGTLLNSDPELG